MVSTDLSQERRKARFWDCAAAVFFVFIALWFIDHLAQSLLIRLHTVWDGQRLAPVFAVYDGYRLYPKAGEGPSVGYTYGPLSVLAYFPTVLASDPTSALLVSYGLTLVYSFGPVVALLALSAKGGVRRFGAVAVGVLVFGILTRNPSLSYSTTSPVHDAVALGLGLLACLSLLGCEDAGWGRLTLSATVAILAVAAKQNAVFALPTLALYTLVAFGRKNALRYVALLVGLGLVLTFVLVGLYRLGPLVHYLLTVQGSMGIVWQRFSELIRFAVYTSLLPLLLIGSALFLKSSPSEADTPPESVRKRLAKNPWVLPFMICLGNVPISVLGALKAAGNSNALSYSFYFLAAAAASLVTQLIAQGVAVAPELGRRVGLTIAALATSQWLWVQFVSAPAPIPLRWSKALQELRTNPSQIAFEYAKRHPGSVYFPWNTLSVLMAEGRLDTSEDALLYIPPAAFNPADPNRGAVLPNDPEYIAFPPQYETALGQNAVLRRFPNYRRHVKVPGLDRFDVYARSDGRSRTP